MIAVDGARTGYALLLRRLLQQRGLAESDVVFKEIGGSQERFDAMKNGAAAASMLNPPFDAADLWPQMNPLTREAFRVRAKCAPRPGPPAGQRR